MRPNLGSDAVRAASSVRRFLTSSRRRSAGTLMTMLKPANASNALKFFEWAYNNGDKMADELDYVPLPDSLTDQIRSKVWSQINNK